MGMFLIYGLNTWLPQMMRQAGYPLGSSLSFLLMLNITAAIGALFAGAIADRIGAKIVISISYLMAAICIGLLTIKPSVTIIYLLIGLAGIGSVGITQILNAYVTQYFPSHIRATSLGWGLGLGRVGAIAGPILVGIIMTMQYDLVWNFTYSHLQVFSRLYLFSLFLQNKRAQTYLCSFHIPQTTCPEIVYLKFQYRSLIPFQFLLHIADSNEFVLLKIDSTPQFLIQHLIQYLPFSLLTTV